jgi:hypothetical protein
LASAASLTPSSGFAEVLTREEQNDAEPTGQAQVPTLVIPTSRGNCGGTITFEHDGPTSRGLSSEERFALRDDICREIAALERWSKAHGWLHTWPQLNVVVAERYSISKSLVPAWNGQSGRMELPAWRVASRKAAIMHELVHVLFPNANRFLAEGLAVYLQAEIGGNPAFPNFGRPLHVVACKILQEQVPGFEAGKRESVDAIRLTDLDAIATPAPLTLHIGSDFYGEEPRGQSRIYPLAGSFTQHLIAIHGLERFYSIYAQTPLVPHEQSAGPADRWLRAYERSLAHLEREWNFMIAGS